VRGFIGVAVSVAALAGACSGSSSDPTAAPGVLGPGKWGGPSALLDVTTSAATVRFDFCAEGTLTVPVLLTPDGRFDVPGTYVRNIGPSISAKSARYVGLWRRASLTLTVLLSEPLGPNESDVVGPFDLTPGHPGPPERPCPIAY
jgi:hypothetical protein